MKNKLFPTISTPATLGITLAIAAIFTFTPISPILAESTSSNSKEMRISNPDNTTYAKPSNEALKKQLTPLQFDVTQNDATERAFNNEYWNNKKQGIYVDIVSGEPLFSSTDKFKSGTGWPSFKRPLENSGLVKKIDKHLFYSRIELRSKLADSHLGHVFDDGPEPTGKRYCINSASLRFIPKQDLKTKGYEKYISLFD